MYNEFENEKDNVEFEEAEIVEEKANEELYSWHKDDFENKTVYGTARPLYKEKLIAPEKKKNNLFRYTAAVVAGMFAGAIIFASASTYVSYKQGLSLP